MEGHPEYIAADTIHPSAVGNVELARLILRHLKDLGLGEKTEPATNKPGIDEIPYLSYILKALREFFTRITAMFSALFQK